MKKTIITITCLIFVCALFGQSQVTHWTQPMNYQSNMNVNSIIFMEDVEQNSMDLEIGAFCGNECRGCALPSGIVEGHTLYLLTISANTNGEAIIFRLFDHQSNRELSYECTETLTFTADMVLGAYPDFYPFHFTPAEPPQSTHWTQPMNFQSNMSVNSTIFIEGVEQNSEFLEIGAFCGNECRGCALPAGMVDGHALYLLTISANTNGESLSFRLYNHWMGQELPYICTETMTFTADMIMGAYPDFYPFHFTTPPPFYHFTTAGNWSEASNWQGGTLPNPGNGVFIDATCTLDMDVEVASLTVTQGQTLALQPGHTLTVTGTLTNINASGLVIKDGAQLIHASGGVFATMEKNVTGYIGNGGYSLIAVPFVNELSVPAQMTAGDYDLYLFDESYPYAEWRNHKADVFRLARGKGYLYANSTGMTLSMAGQIPPTSNPYSANLTFDANAIVPGFNLVGNPFTCDAYLDRPYYMLKEDGTGINPVPVPATTPITPCTAVFVKAVGENDTVVFTKAVQ